MNRYKGGNIKNMMTRYINSDILRSEEDDRMNRIAMIRKASGFTQAELAKMTGLTQPYIANVESGKVKIENVSLKNGLILSSVLGCRMDDLLDNRDAIVAETRARTSKVLQETEMSIRRDKKLAAMQNVVKSMDRKSAKKSATAV